MTAPIKPCQPPEKGAPWTTADDDRLESLIRAGKLIREAAQELGRSMYAVKSRIGQIGLRVSDRRRANMAPQVLASRAIRSGIVQHTPTGLIHLCGDDDVRC